MELDQLLDLATNLFSKIEPSTIHSFYSRNPILRPGLSLLESQNKNIFGPEKSLSLNAPSSDEDSTDKEDSYPSTYEIIEKIMDSEYTTITVFTHTG